MKRIILILVAMITISCATQQPPLIVGQNMVCVYKLNNLVHFEAVHRISLPIEQLETITVRMTTKSPDKYEIGKTYKIYRNGI